MSMHFHSRACSIGGVRTLPRRLAITPSATSSRPALLDGRHGPARRLGREPRGSLPRGTACGGTSIGASAKTLIGSRTSSGPLNQIEKAIEDVAMEEPRVARQKDITAKIEAIRSNIESATAEAISLHDFERDPSPQPAHREPATTLAGLEQLLIVGPNDSSTSVAALRHPEGHLLDQASRAASRGLRSHVLRNSVCTRLASSNSWPGQ